MIPPLVFLDSSCLVAATLSPSGGSGKIVALAAQGRLALVVSPLIIAEVVRTLSEKFGQGELQRFLANLMIPQLYRTPAPTEEECESWAEVTDIRDCHVLAAAFNSHCDCLVTLDRKHLLTDVVRARFPYEVMNPAEFLEWFYKQEELP